MLVVRFAGRSVVGYRGRSVADHLQEVRPHRVEAVMCREAIVLLKRLQELQPGRRTMDHGRGDGAIEP